MPHFAFILYMIVCLYLKDFISRTKKIPFRNITASVANLPAHSAHMYNVSTNKAFCIHIFKKQTRLMAIYLEHTE